MCTYDVQPNEHNSNPSSYGMRLPVVRALCHNDSHDNLTDAHACRRSESQRTSTKLVNNKNGWDGNGDVDDACNASSEKRRRRAREAQ